MKVLLGILIIVVGVLGAIFLGGVMLVYGVWDILNTWETMTFWQLFWDVMLISLREIVATVICYFSIILGFGLIANHFGSFLNRRRRSKNWSK
jgi:ABC-type Fe3+ transport system permease subunit